MKPSRLAIFLPATGDTVLSLEAAAWSLVVGLFLAAAFCWWRYRVWSRRFVSLYEEYPNFTEAESQAARCEWRYYFAARRLLIGGVVILLLTLGLTASGQPLKPGVGLPGVPEGFARRSVPESSWKGHYAEMEFATWEALRNACRANLYNTASTHTCEPTRSEADWVIVHENRHGPFYQRWWHEQGVGGTRENPQVLAPGGLSDNIVKSIRANAERCGGRWQLGLFSYPGFWGDSCRGRGWPIWVDNKLPPTHPVNVGIAAPGSPGEPSGPPPVTCPGSWSPAPAPAIVLSSGRMVTYIEGGDKQCCWIDQTIWPKLRAYSPGCLAAQPDPCPADGHCSPAEAALVLSGTSCGDCPVPSPSCGDGVWQQHEEVTGSCPSDAPSTSSCGDGVCAGTETPAGCPADCPPDGELCGSELNELFRAAEAVRRCVSLAGQ